MLEQRARHPCKSVAGVADGLQGVRIDACVHDRISGLKLCPLLRMYGV